MESCERSKKGCGYRFRRFRDWILGFKTSHLALEIESLKNDIQVKDKIISELRKKNLTWAGRIGTSQFDLLRILGIGGYGTVYLAKKRGGADDGQLYAMKVLKKTSIIQGDDVKVAMAERRVLEAVGQHPFLTALHYAFQTDSKLYLVLDYMCGGTLLTHSYSRTFTEDDVRFYNVEITLALEHLHKLHIIHRDVKLENILLDSQGHAVLSDFGLSKIFLPHKVHRAHSTCGTLSYTAPEVIVKSDAGYDIAVDWWSLGIITYELLIGETPFERQNESLTNEELASRIITTEPDIPDDLSFDAADFISQLLVKDPQKRLGGGKDDAEELKRHPFLKGMNWSDMAQKKILAPFLPTKTNELDDTNFPEEFIQKIPAHLPATLPSNCDELFRGYSFVSPSCKIKNLEMGYSVTKRVQKRSDMEKRLMESDPRAATEKIKSLEAELIRANCVQQRYNWEKRRLRKDLRDAKKKITSLEVKLNKANCTRMRYNDKKSMLEIDLRDAIKRIQSLETKFAKATWKKYNKEPPRMQTQLRSGKKKKRSLEAELTEANRAQQMSKRNERRLKTDQRGAI
ncbi:hypothetical protein B7P43_G10867 [Cryptotermes secundus]|uniref:non-specific serine/threonine protein kinase n=1 Tax=Cryptotermes secundus TaxID=105785 RepID=A0A2J7QPI5_9NEOP|nr:ribosomal protein S6 kinase alpha-5-like [Cryptotermes secundus]PNF30492.1 hypothetical protein B7P43_G10867 [Cryptotermes secundus]